MTPRRATLPRPIRYCECGTKLAMDQRLDRCSPCAKREVDERVDAAYRAWVGEPILVWPTEMPRRQDTTG